MKQLTHEGVRRATPKAERIGIIGGSGLYQIESLIKQKRVKVKTPFGDPSDCDFNQMLKMQVRNGKPLYLWDVTPERLEGWDIQTGVHCLACTAGCGSSCTGAVK